MTSSTSHAWNNSPFPEATNLSFSPASQKNTSIWHRQSSHTSCGWLILIHVGKHWPTFVRIFFSPSPHPSPSLSICLLWNRVSTSLTYSLKNTHQSSVPIPNPRLRCEDNFFLGPFGLPAPRSCSFSPFSDSTTSFCTTEWGQDKVHAFPQKRWLSKKYEYAVYIYSVIYAHAYPRHYSYHR